MTTSSATFKPQPTMASIPETPDGKSNGNHQQSNKADLHNPNAKKKPNDKPLYVINSVDNRALNLFKIAMGIVAVPSVICNLFL
jgi:hypothetical protein